MTFTTDPGDSTVFPRQTVEYTTNIKNKDSWVLVPYLWCAQLKLAANAYSTAQLRYEIGQEVLQPGDNLYRDWQPVSLRTKYVRVTMISDDIDIPSLVWVGYVLDDNVSRDGVVDDAGTNKFQGEAQLFQCVGLEWFLDREQIDSAVVHNPAGDPIRILRPLRFNGGESTTIDMKAAHRGNRSDDVDIDDVYVFTDDPTTDNEWSPDDIVDYLLMYHTPRDSADDPSPCQYVLDDGDSATGFLKGWAPTAFNERLTVFAMLNKLASPARGLVWWLEFDSFGVINSMPQAYIRINSLADGDITLPGGGDFPANDNQVALDFDGELDVKSATLKNLGSRNYHRIITRGARQTVTFTVGYNDDTLVEDWKSDAETAYRDAANADGDYAGLGRAKQSDRNDAMRQNDILSRVFSYFRIPATWNGKSGDGDTATRKFAIATISNTGSVVGGTPLTVAGLRLLRQTRLKLGVDYTNPMSPIDNTPDGSLEEFLRPFAIFQVEQEPAIGSNPSPNRYQYCDTLHSPQFHGGTKVAPNIHTNYHLSMQEHTPGIILKAAGAPNHVLALDFFDGSIGGGDEPSAFKPEVSYQTLRATVCAESDNFAQGVYAVDPLPDGVPIQELVIDMGDDYRLDFLAESTLLGLDKGIPTLASTAAVLRDDRATLRDICRIAFEWYREDRNQLTVEFRQLRNLFSLGQMITTIGTGSTQSVVKTVVSVITYDFGKAGTMTIETSDNTLDARVAFGTKRAAKKS